MRAALSRIKRRIVRSIGPSALVLTYHRVTSLDRDTQLLAVSPEHFAEHLELLAHRYHVMPLGSLLDAVRSGSLVDGSVAITFDDGYADNLHELLPLLESARVPATVFASSGYIESGREYWWDELERLLLTQPLSGCRVTLQAPGSSLDLSIPASASPCDASWNVLVPPSCEAARAYLAASEFLRPLHARDREHCLDTLATALATSRLPRPSHRPMTADELARLDSSPWVEVGAHGAEHEVFACLSPEKQRASIERDKIALSTICGREMRLFSYPFGGRSDFTAETITHVRGTGFAGAVANYPGLIKRFSDPFSLPRLVVRDWGAEELGTQLAAWLGR